MNNLQFHTGGFPLETETLDFLQEQTKMVTALSALGGSDTYILSGVVTEGGNVTDGYIVYLGEVLPFTGGALQTNVTIIETQEEVIYQADDDGDGQGDSKIAYTRRMAKFGNDGVETFEFSLLKPFIEGIGGQIFKTFFKDVRLPYIGAIGDIPVGWELCEILSGHFPVIYDPDNPDYNTIGGTGGADEVTLTEAQMPIHSHNGSTKSAGSHNHTGNTSTNGAHTHTGSTNNAGSHKHTGSTYSGGSHSHSYRDGYFIEAFTSPNDVISGYGSENVGDNFRGSGDTDSDNRYIWYKNRSTNSGGSHSHTLNMGNAGEHNHSFTTNSQGGHNHSFSTSNNGSHNHSVTTQNKGGNSAHENRPKYKVIALIKYVGV